MNIFFILFIVVASLCCNYSLCKQDFAYGNSYYVDPNKGDDGKIGNLSAPWRTIKNSVSRLQPGDTLYLRGGTYYESQIKISNQGAKSKKIIIKNYPDESPIIDGGYAEFRIVPNSDWEIHDAKKNIYRSVKTYSSADSIIIVALSLMKVIMILAQRMKIILLLVMFISVPVYFGIVLMRRSISG